MRYSQNHKAETRQRIIAEASRRFRRDGIEGTGLVPLMKALGMTHGGFYAHFPSKEALVEASLDAAVAQADEQWQASPAPEQLQALLASYLSTRHRDHPEAGCPLPTLCAELGLRGQPNPSADALARRMAARVQECTPAAGGADGGLVALAAMVGALTLSRAVADPALSEQILGAVHAALQPPAQA
ncbi:TetR/AcrR family transcriptional regulator [Massilia norwichensis]|uniref:TetR/AcrR family transcriptional regulator n=1 Tax=Massilia norwichensis TaxID=1442366 RepID=A0ABT2A877_9BURK|nr:TetR/AcrR family transcriptional regulator [Massilia norwichensis]MCS0590305.1 TetR/AcrR family transcriptional regulator [Massilia norwichensis]